MEYKTEHKKHRKAKLSAIKENVSDEIGQIELGTRFTLGKPMSGSYQYLAIKPAIGGSSMSKLLPIKTLERKMVITRGILKLGRDKILICLTRTDEKPFYGDVIRIYADLFNSLKTKELIKL